MQLSADLKNISASSSSAHNVTQGDEKKLPGKKMPEGVPGARRISLLTNGVYYFIETVFLLETVEGYRLIAIHGGKLLIDETYKTAKGARIAFLKFYGYKAWEEGVKPFWTPFYPPEENVGPLKTFDDIIEKMKR